MTELIMEKYHKKTIKYYQSFKDWCKSNKIENEIANNKNLKIFLSNCIEIINNILSYLNFNVFNENFLNSFISQDSDTLDRFYKKLDLNFKDKLDEDYVNKFNKFKLSFNGQNLVGIILSYNDNKSKQLLNVIKDLLNLNHSS